MRPPTLNENFPYTFTQIQLWQGRSSHCTATQHRRISYGLPIVLSPSPYYYPGTRKGFLICLPVLYLQTTAPFPFPASGSAAGLPCSLPRQEEASSGQHEGVGKLQSSSNEAALFLQQITNKANNQHYTKTGKVLWVLQAQDESRWGSCGECGRGLRGKAELIASQPDNIRQETDVQETTEGYSNTRTNSPANRGSSDTQSWPAPWEQGV